MNKIRSNFWSDLQRGKQGEILVKNAFSAMGYEVVDVTDNKEYWSKDIDLLIYDKYGEEHQFEVKSDWNMYKTNNIVLELGNREHLGWFNYSEASHFAFCDMRNNIAYIFRSKELHEYIRKHVNDLKRIEINDYNCVLINLADIENLYQQVKLAS